MITKIALMLIALSANVTMNAMDVEKKAKSDAVQQEVEFKKVLPAIEALCVKITSKDKATHKVPAMSMSIVQSVAEYPTPLR